MEVKEKQAGNLDSGKADGPQNQAVSFRDLDKDVENMSL